MNEDDEKLVAENAALHQAMDSMTLWLRDIAKAAGLDASTSGPTDVIARIAALSKALEEARAERNAYKAVYERYFSLQTGDVQLLMTAAVRAESAEAALAKLRGGCMKAYCDCCMRMNPASFRAGKDSVSGADFEDLCCDECHYIIATVMNRAMLAAHAKGAQG